MASPTVAIVGSGPSGCYLAQALRKAWPDTEISVLDRLPVPYGLVRYGVAPDHPGTKAVTRQFDRLFERENIRFVGNLEIGRDLALDELRGACDVVVLATGLYGDRRLGVPGDDLERVHGAGRLTRFFNDHPDEVGLAPRFGQRTAIVGNGNVAIDLLRLLAKSADEFAGSDISETVLAHLAGERPQTIHIVGRSPAMLAKFDTVMLRELGKLRDVTFALGEGALLHAEEGDAAKLGALRELLERPVTGARQVVFHFGWEPERVHGASGVEGIAFVRQGGERLELAVDSVLTAIGFAEDAGGALRRDSLSGAVAELDAGCLDHGLYCAGWYRRGPRGTIPENRADARRVADAIIQAVSDGRLTVGKPGFASLGAAFAGPRVAYEGWKRIDAFELEQAPADRQRRKIRTISDMLRIAQP